MVPFGIRTKPNTLLILAAHKSISRQQSPPIDHVVSATTVRIHLLPGYQLRVLQQMHREQKLDVP